MAGRDYFDAPYSRNYPISPDRRDGQLPPIPSQYTPSSFSHPNSRMPSSYPYGSDSSFSGSPYQKPYHKDPVEDYGAVPLRPYNPKRDSANSLAPIISHHEIPREVDVKSGKRRKYEDELPPPPVPANQGWFKGKITWCCYIFTLIQTCVFIAELARNGKSFMIWNDNQS